MAHSDVPALTGHWIQPTGLERDEGYRHPKGKLNSYSTYQSFPAHPPLQPPVEGGGDGGVQWFILDNILTRPLVNQHAYTRKLQTKSALTQLKDLLERPRLTGRHAIVVRFDSAWMGLRHSQLLGRQRSRPCISADVSLFIIIVAFDSAKVP